MERDVSSDYGVILESMERVSRLTSLVTMMDAGLPKLLASSGYKSQRKSYTRGGRGGREERLQKNQGIENGRKEERLKIPERAIGREEEAN